MAFLLVLLSIPVSAYIQDRTQQFYSPGAPIDLFAATLTSSETLLSFSYYYFPFCQVPVSSLHFENIGQALSGDMIEETPYKLRMSTDFFCKVLCQTELEKIEIREFRWMIDHKYRVQWIMDRLPSGLRITLADQAKNLVNYENGFPIGYESDGEYFLYNHHHIIVKVHSEDSEEKTIVGFLVQPFSLKHSDQLSCSSQTFTDFLTKAGTYEEVNLGADSENENELLVRQTNSFIDPQDLKQHVKFSYSVVFEPSEIRWTSRWDIYLKNNYMSEHWLSIINSSSLALILSAILGRILVNMHYGQSQGTDMDQQPEWKLMKAEVFREPEYEALFTLLVGSGVQVLSMCFFTLFYASTGFIQPGDRGSLLSAMIAFFSMSGILAGAVSGRLYKTFSGSFWKINAFGTAFVFPSLAFLIFFLINLWNLSESTSNSVSFRDLTQLLMIWLLISLPLTYLGSALGFKTAPHINVTVVSHTQAPLPLENSNRFYALVAVCVALPFVSALVEVNYIMNIVWKHSTAYFLFGFLMMNFLLVVVVTGEVTVIVVYEMLCRGDYRWWWVSVLAPGSSGAVVFLYAGWYYFWSTGIGGIFSMAVYFGYMVIVSLIWFLVIGTVGFLACFGFVRKIYSMVELE